MLQPEAQDMGIPDPVELSKSISSIAEKSHKILIDWVERQTAGNGSTALDPMNICQAFLEMTAKMMTDPSKLVQAQINLWQDYMSLWQSTAQRAMGQETEPAATPTKDDRRFTDPAWDENQLFDFIKQSYLLSARWMQSTVKSVDGLDQKTAKKVDFYTRQFVDAMAPSNFVLTNPEVLRATMESGGENLIKGLQNVLDDLDRGNGTLAIKMTDSEAFEVGRNLAITPGKVVYENDLMQLIQYDPTTEKVYRKPLLIMPPWINKYYILDLREKNSFVKWAVAQGFTVFVISWVNPDESLAEKTFSDYLLEGPLAACDAITKATGESQINAIGYCLGGSLLAATLAFMKAKGDRRIASVTLLTTMIDFTESGELGVFIDEEQLAALEARMNERGYLEGSEMATTFNMLRANDLIWSFVVNNYLLGKDPFPFDLLYWNSDSTRMPAAMHSFYLRTMYQENKLAEPGGITLDGVPIDLSTVKVPAFFLSTREDHIAPWESTYGGAQLFSGPVRFVLAASGHIAGVINPPAGHKYSYWTNDKLPKSPQTWFREAQEHQGSWWPEWLEWVRAKSGAKIPARQPGDGELPVIEAAPGAYVKVRVSD
jgi:polyhydroxyalkanoate synthase